MPTVRKEIGKIKTLTELKRISQQVKAAGGTTGLVTGCFDILHIGHIRLFRSAKERVDLLIVGIENDETIRRSKGRNRPIFPQDIRADALSELTSIDYIFINEEIFTCSDPEAIPIFRGILQHLMPTFLFTNSMADIYWHIKEKLTTTVGIEIIDLKRPKETSSSAIIKLIEV